MNKKHREIEQYRQGDVLLKKIKSIPVSSARLSGQERIVLAYGEATGHTHVIGDVENVAVFVGKEGQLYLEVLSQVALEHEEHGTIQIPVGTYERIIQKEYSPEAIRNVRD